MFNLATYPMCSRRPVHPLVSALPSPSASTQDANPTRARSPALRTTLLNLEQSITPWKPPHCPAGSRRPTQRDHHHRRAHLHGSPYLAACHVDLDSQRQQFKSSTFDRRSRGLIGCVEAVSANGVSSRNEHSAVFVELVIDILDRFPRLRTFTKTAHTPSTLPLTSE